MKTINIYFLCCALFLLCGCNSFLEETSNDEIIPKSAQDYSEFLFGEAYIRDTKDLAPYLDIMTDDVKESRSSKNATIFSPDNRLSGYGYHTWQRVPEIQISGALNEDIAWGPYYHMILISNVVLNEIEHASGSESLRQQVKAEAHMIRAHSYFMLVNLYGKPYHKETAASDLGVPINTLTHMEDVKYPRSSVAKVYEVIIRDIEDALKAFALSDESKSIFRWNIDAAHVFASRVYLYLKEYDRVIQYASEAIKSRPVLYDLNTMSDEEDYFLNAGNPEIFFTYGQNSPEYNAAGVGTFPIADDFAAMFGKNDLRYGSSNGVFVRMKGNFLSGKSLLPFKSGDDTGVYGYAIRAAEAYLNRAEAYAETDNAKLAMADLNRIRKARLKTEGYAELSAASQEEAIALTRKERRLELCFEQHRWFDLRRYGCPSLTHQFTMSTEPLLVETYVLEENDPAYTLPIPKTVMDYEPDLINNPRPDRPGK